MTKGRMALYAAVAAKTADPSTTLLRSSGWDDKEMVVAYLKKCDWDV
jgi:hypothetical protein